MITSSHSFDFGEDQYIYIYVYMLTTHLHVYTLHAHVYHIDRNISDEYISDVRFS